MAYNNEAELQEFLRYIREDESYDERGNLNADLLRQNMRLGTLYAIAKKFIIDTEYYSPERDSKDIYKMIDSVCNEFGVDKNLLKNRNNGNYKNIPQKYWGIVLKIIKYTYINHIDNKPKSKSYLCYLTKKTSYNSLDEFEEQQMLHDLVDDLEQYIETCICEKEQYLFTTSRGKDIHIPFRCMRYVENKYLCEHLDPQDNNELWQIIFSKFENMDKFNECIDNPKKFEKLKKDNNIGDKFTSLWNDYVTKSKGKDDYPKSYSYPAYFCEEDFNILLEGITHNKALQRFYSSTNKNDEYINILDKLQAIADMYYVVNLYTDEEEKQNSEKNHSEIAKFVNKEYDEISKRFISYYQKILDETTETNEKSDSLKKFQLTFTKQIAINALSEHCDLCAKLGIVPVNRTSTKKYNK